MSVWLSPASSRARASWRWWGVSLGGRPKRTPRSLADHTLPTTGTNQLPLELRQPAQDRDDQAPTTQLSHVK
jgi:hypothetical protein